MRLIRALFYVFLLFIASCTLLKKNKESKEPVIYQPSELALLMRKMYDDGASLKKQIEQNQWPDSFPDYQQLHSAKATDPSDINETYHALSDVYLANHDSLKASPVELRVERFNNLVNSCVSCHRVYCLGPIPKIEGLLLR